MRHLIAPREISRLTAPLIIALIVLDPWAIHAAHDQYDGFASAPGTPLHGAGGGIGFDGGWYGSSSYTVAAGSLGVPGLLTEGGHVVTGPDADRISRAFQAFGNDGTTSYLSFYLRPDGDLVGRLGVELQGHNATLFVGKPSNDHYRNYGLQKADGVGQVSAPLEAVKGVGVFVVVKCQSLPGNDRVTLYLNPVPGEPEPASGTVKDDVDWGVFLLVSLHATSAASFDEVRLGETYEQVTSVTCAPEFGGQPADTTAVLGRPFTLRVRPGGTRPASMRWHKDGNPLVNGGTIAGTETMALTIDPVTATDAGAYQLRTIGTCIVTDSRIAAVSVAPLLITNQPRSHYTAVGSNAVLSVGVESATPVIYQWQFENSNLTGETNAVLVRNSIGPSGTGNYRVICQNASATVISEPAWIEVMANSFLGQPETNPANGHLYFVLPNSDWTNAENASVRLGGHLVTINDAAENTYVCERFRDFAGGLRHLWLGFVDGDVEHNSYFTNHRMNEFGWTSGQPVTYANWWRTDPNNLIIEPYLGGEFVVWLASFATTWGDIAYNNTNMFGGSPVFTHGLAEIEITPPVPPLPNNVGVVLGATVVLNGRSGGLLPQSFQWFLNGQPLVGQTSEILRIENSQVTDSGTYSVTVSNRLGVVSGVVAVVTVTILPPTSLDYLVADFEGGKPSQLSGGTRVDSQGFSAHGFGRHLLVSQGDTNAGNAVTLTLTGLPAHTSVDLDFLLAIINSWDGWAPAPGGHDLFNVEVDGVSVYRYHFSNLWLGNMINPPPSTAIVFQTNNMGFPATGGGAVDWVDSAYRVGLRAVPHSASTLTIRWYADGNGWTGGTNPTDEFWGIDNLRVGLNNVTQSAPVIALQPSSKTVPIGGVATFTAAAAGWPEPNYAWYREGSTTPLGVGGSLSFGPVSGAEAGDYYVVASNAFGSAISAVASLTLSDNQPPAPAAPLPDQSVLAGAPFNFAVPAGTFTDPDPGQTLTYSASGLPAGVTFNPATRAFGGVPLSGVHVIAVSVTDNGIPPLSSSDTFLLTVSSGGLAHFEGFDYPAGALAGRNGGNGFIGPWYGGTYSSTGGSLALPGTPSVGGRGFSSATSGNVARRPLNPVFFGDGTTRYFSVRLRSDGPPTGWFGVSLFGNAGRGLFVGKPGGTTTTNYVIENAGGGQQVIAPHTAANGSNVFLVVRCEFFSGNDRLTLFVNPTPGLPEPIEGIVKYNADFGVLTNLELTGSSPYSVDEIRIGTSFSEVAPAVCPPVFVTQPANPPAVLGLPLTLTARAAGQGPLEYQWRKDGVPLLDYGPFTGTRTDTLVIPSPTAADGGAYDVVVTNPCDALTSQVATISVQGLAFVTQPLSQAIKPGSNAVFSVSVLSASPVRYQWQFNGVNIENATSPTLAVLNAQVAQRGNYRCVAHNSLGDFPSADAYLEVIVAPTFVEHPQSLTVAVGANASFSAAVTITASVPITFTLRKGSTSLANPPPQTLMSTSCTFTLMNVQLTDAGSYRIVATNIAGQLLGSSSATLAVMEPPIITSQPQDQSVTLGATSTFTVGASGGGPLKHQWRFNGAEIPGATNSTLTITGVTYLDLGDYGAVVSNPVGAVTSTAARLSLAGVQINHFPQTAVVFDLCTSSTTEKVIASGTTTVATDLGAHGETTLTDGAGHDRALTHLLAMNLNGSSTLGAISLRLNSNLAGDGELIERANATPGTLDLPPYRPAGLADDCFNLYLEVVVQTPSGPLVLHNLDPIRRCGVIDSNPPAPGAVYGGSEPVPLHLPNGQPSGFSICALQQMPVPPVEQPRVEASVQTTGSELVLVWEPHGILPGTLQTKDDLTSGDWRTIPDARPPFHVPLGQSKGFYRVVYLPGPQ